MIRLGKVTCTVYGEKKEFQSRKEAIDYFIEGMDYCDPRSSEYGRYERIVSQLLCGYTDCSDEQEV